MSKNYLICVVAIFLIYSCAFQKTSKHNIPLVRKPYLQSALSDSTTILWRTAIGSECKVAFKEKNKKDWTYVDGITRLTNTKVIENEVCLPNLKANTTYEYQIYTDDQRMLKGQNLWFSSPVSNSDTSFTFFAVGDIGEPIEEGGTPDKLGISLSKYVDSFNFGLLLGDIIYPDGKSELYDKNLFQYFGKIFPYVPVFTVLGNHDWHEPDENYLKEWKLPGNEHYYSFDYGNTHFIGLDTKNGELYEYEKQVNWLEKDLSKNTDKADWIVVFLHHNGKSCTYKKDYEGVVSLYPIFEKHGVDLILNGHAHTYERLNPMNGSGEVVLNHKKINDPSKKGFISITVGSGGKLRGVGTDPKPFTPNPDNCKYPNLVAAYSHQWAFLTLEIDGKQLKGKAISTENNEILDEFVINK